MVRKIQTLLSLYGWGFFHDECIRLYYKLAFFIQLSNFFFFFSVQRNKGKIKEKLKRIKKNENYRSTRLGFFSFLHGYNIFELVEIFQNSLEILEHLSFIKINVEVALSELSGVRHSVLGSACGSALLFSLNTFICLKQYVF